MKRSTTIIYEPNQRSRIGLLKTWGILVHNTIAHRELIYQLFKRDFLMQHKRSFLGMGWLLFGPIIGIVSWVLMNATGILQPGDVGIPYPAYVLFSSSIWGLFMAFYNNTAESLQVAQGFILQVNFPHEILVVKQALQVIANFMITLAVNLVILLFLGVIPSWLILFLPVFLLPLLFAGAAIGMCVSIIKVVAPDLQRGFTFLMGLLMFITPVIYAKNVKNPLLAKVIKWNPLTYLVGGVRDAVIYGRVDNVLAYCISATAALLIFFWAWRLFFVSEQRVMEKLI